MPNLARTPPQRVSPLPRSPIPSPAPDLAAFTSHTEAAASSSAPASATTPEARDARQSAGNASLPSIASPTRAFAPRNPGVMRSPPAGSQIQQPTRAVPVMNGREQDAVPIGVPDIEVQEASLVDIEPETGGVEEKIVQEDTAGAGGAAEVDGSLAGGEKRKRVDDEDFIDQQVQAGLSTDPAGMATSTTPTQTPPAKRQPVQPSPSTSTSTAAQPPIVDPIPAASTSSRTSRTSPPASAPTPAAHAPQTPTSRHRRRSTRTAAEVAEAASIINAPIEPLEGSEEFGRYGRRYATTMEILEAASKAAAMRWTKKDLEQCFPLISAAHPGTMKEVWEDTAKALQAEILSSAKQCFDGQDTGLALKMLQEAVEEAKEYKKNGGGRRADAWRPDLTPHGITAAANMAIYDDAYDKLLMEYTGLHKDCTDRFASIKAKQAELAAFETGVSDGVVELEKSLEVVADFPTAEMKEWAEGKMDEMHGVRPT